LYKHIIADPDIPGADAVNRLRTLPRVATAANDAREEALRSLRGIYASMRRRSAQVRQATGLGSASIWALAEIAAHPGTRVADLAGQLRVHPSTASNLCAQLRRAGLVIARLSPDDRRATSLFITASGRAALKKVPPRRGGLAEALQRLSSEDCRALSLALVPLVRAAARR
jgi:DNA-binding MarR family transcriptional regulator